MHQEFRCFPKCYKAGITISPGSRALQPSLWEVPARRRLSRQEPAFFCGTALSPGVKQWCRAATAFRNQKSWVPDSFLEELNPHLYFPVQCSHHQVRLTSSLIPDSVLSFCTVIQLQQERKKKSCGREKSTANPCDVQSPPWLLQSMQQSIPVKVYGTEIQVTACQLHFSSFLCAYHRFTLW